MRRHSSRRDGRLAAQAVQDGGAAGEDEEGEGAGRGAEEEGDRPDDGAEVEAGDVQRLLASQKGHVPVKRGPRGYDADGAEQASEESGQVAGEEAAEAGEGPADEGGVGEVLGLVGEQGLVVSGVEARAAGHAVAKVGRHEADAAAREAEEPGGEDVVCGYERDGWPRGARLLAVDPSGVDGMHARAHPWRKNCGYDYVDHRADGKQPCIRDIATGYYQF